MQLQAPQLVQVADQYGNPVIGYYDNAGNFIPQQMQQPVYNTGYPIQQPYANNGGQMYNGGRQQPRPLSGRQLNNQHRSGGGFPTRY